ncbi:MarR family winged helix-turn-helix transcriptional regulator [Vagococcus fluvialis]|uniref:MarR family transcriptional regulator n=1 Tax=Vagococcus fluvialis TaxID=2738 RepID=A0A369AYD1_9ENTE|nr:MarR family transcriptional regulator [Vagococcus fluvialis]MBO0442934.1 MarR family transcriptional regulator [Vagococcus fluvialis]MBO0478657.1 MarR family transcriptional regulator [Vagococcus fluvialis]MBO0484499.1 MarR family transcriptional regulator [Vagococcus fluvialis]MBO0487311.1 MarR family transcriptional regulator [Vagococcus fluvialis]MCM2139557.1 MarR family transcriptional regulator [Vagococcus fluvialis]
MNQGLIKNILLSLRELRKETHTLLEEQSKKYQLSMTQIFALDMIRQNPKLSLRELAKKVNLSPSTTSEVVEKMVQAGLVEREQSEKNRRRIELSLSNKGLDTLESTYSDWIDDFSILDELGDDKLQAFYETQQEMIDLLKKRRVSDESNETK